VANVVTTRQQIALLLFYVEGYSHRRIGESLGIKHASVQRLILRGSRWLICAAAEEGGATSPRLRALLAPSPTTDPTRNVGLAALRQDELLDALELHMEREARTADAIRECMSGDSHLPTHVKRNSFDQWELRYAMDHECFQLPTSAYNARVAQRYCGMDVDAVRY
jgi:hypothetical protein